MKRPLNRMTISLAALAFAQCATSAYAAQGTTETPSVDAATANAADATEAEAAPGDNDGLVDIVVTATKRETNLQKTPIAINVMTTEDIKKRHVQSLIDLADGAIPSLRIATFEARTSALTIGMRGIVPLDANQPAREQGVGVYIDGVYLGRQHGLNAGLLDVERIEVLKGPQGTLFGRNTEGGAVNIVSKAPTGEFGGRATAGIGNYGSYNGALHLDLPAFANLSFKIDAAIQHQDETVKNPLAGNVGWNYAHRYGGRIGARWTPNSDITVDLAYDVGRDNNTPFYSQLINYNPTGLPVATLAQIAAAGNKVPKGFIAPLPSIVKVSADRVSTADIGLPQQESVGKTHGYFANMKWKISSNMELRSITAWREVSDDQWDNSGGAHRTPVFLPNTAFSRYSLATLDQRQFSQELQAVGSLTNLNYVFGLYYFNEKAGDTARTPNTNKWNADGTGFTINDIATFATSPLARASTAYSKSYSAYGQATYTPAGADNLHITAGGRYTNDKKHGLLYNVNNVATNFTFKQSTKRFDPLAILAWSPAQGVDLYAKYATGYRAGGASSRSLTYRSFGPESVKSYEIGAKTEFLDRRVRLNVAAYMMDRKNSQVDFNFFVPQSNGTIRNTLETVNAAGITKIRGVEADLTIRPTEGLTMGLSYVYTYTRIPRARNTVQEQLNASLTPPVAGQVFQDVFIVFTPRNAASGSIDYEMPMGNGDTKIKLHLDGNYSQAAYTFDNEAVKNQPSFLVNGRLSIADIPMSDNGQKLTISLWGRNLFNEQHIYRRSNANGAVLGDYANFNAPRTFGLEGTLSF